MYEQFGAFGAWLNPALGDQARIHYAPELEELGFGTIWLGIGADPSVTCPWSRGCWMPRRR